MPASKRTLVAAVFALLAAPGLQAQAGTPHMILATAHETTLEVGAMTPVIVRIVDADGTVLGVPVRVTAPRDALRIEGDGNPSIVHALSVGTHRITATEVVPPGADREPLTATVEIEVTWPAIARVELAPVRSERLFEGTVVRYEARALHADGSERPDIERVAWSTSAPEVARVNAFGEVSALAAGSFELNAEIDGVRGALAVRSEPFPAVSLTLEGGEEEARTGDVLNFRAVLRDEGGQVVEGVPVEWSHRYRAPGDLPAPQAQGQLEEGRFVADMPGEYTVIASAGPLTARHTLEAVPRAVVRSLDVVGQGRQDQVRTTDFWVFEGVDGRDYVITGAKMSDGHAYVFDVTDPANIVKTDSIQVDARSINDVKVSPDGRYATVTREGNSERRNGVVILDLAVPAHPKVAVDFTDRLTGGVHNAFPLENHVFALSGGQSYVILNVEDIYNPHVVSEVRHEDCRIHDVWVHDGVAYSAQWGCGVIAYDVGNGRWGGTLEEPVYINSFRVPGVAATHAVFPYYQESTGKFYLFLGDEIMNRRGLAWEGVPGNYQIPYNPETGQGGTILSTRGYIQIVDFTDPAEPEMVARYEVPEFGTHNIWVEDDVLYQAYYEGGLRVVDISGELMGNLYTQGREIAVYRSADPIGYVPNSPMVWSAMPYKGYIFFTDTNSGIWAVRLQPPTEPVM